MRILAKAKTYDVYNEFHYAAEAKKLQKKPAAVYYHQSIELHAHG